MSNKEPITEEISLVIPTTESVTQITKKLPIPPKKTSEPVKTVSVKNISPPAPTVLIKNVPSKNVTSKTIVDTNKSYNVKPTNLEKKYITQDPLSNISSETGIEKKIPTKQSNKTVQAEKTVLANPNNGDVDDILKKIKEKLDNMDHVSTLKLEKSDILKIGDNKISAACMLHFLSADINFLNGFADQCSNVINEKKDSKGTLSLTELIALSKDKNFKNDSLFYDNLYGFNIEMANIIGRSESFKNALPETKKKLLDNYASFVKESLRYLTEYMKRYQIIDDKLLTSSYNLLYLLNSVTLKRVNSQQDTSQLLALNKKLTDTIKKNIDMYTSIDTSKIKTSLTGVATSDPKVKKAIDELTNKLAERVKKLETDGETITKQIQALNNNQLSMTTVVSPDVINLSDEIINKNNY